MDLALRDRVGIVTGASRGLGEVEAEALAAEGGAVVLATAKSVSEVKQVAQRLEALAVANILP